MEWSANLVRWIEEREKMWLRFDMTPADSRVLSQSSYMLVQFQDCPQSRRCPLVSISVSCPQADTRVKCNCSLHNRTGEKRGKFGRQAKRLKDRLVEASILPTRQRRGALGSPVVSLHAPRPGLYVARSVSCACELSGRQNGPAEMSAFLAVSDFATID